MTSPRRRPFIIPAPFSVIAPSRKAGTVERAGANYKKEVRPMHKIIFALTLVSIISVTAFTQQSNPSTSDPKARAQEVLKQARAALWDETKKPWQSLSITASSRRSMGQMQMASELTLDILMPDKFLRTEVSDFGTNIQAINGTQTWSDFKRN